MNTTLTKALKMNETENNISQNRRSELNALMNQRLADAIDLQMQIKQAHWNVKGPSFIGLHELFDKVEEAVESYVDMIAERIVQLGGIAEGTVRVVARRSRLDEYPLSIADGLAHVEAVARAGGLRRADLHPGRDRDLRCQRFCDWADDRGYVHGCLGYFHHRK